MFGRLYAPDPKDLDHPLRPLAAAVKRTVEERRYRYWWANGWWGDQGDTSECVGYAWAHYVEDSPITHPLGLQPYIHPHDIYTSAKLVDEWDGTDYDGTSVRAGVKVLQSKGLIESYKWALNVQDVIDAVLYLGPVIMGTNWYEGMGYNWYLDRDQALREGYILKVDGPVVGGHAWVINGVNVNSGLFRMKNSWGREWGKDGAAWIKFDDIARLIEEDGESCIAVEAHG